MWETLCSPLGQIGLRSSQQRSSVKKLFINMSGKLPEETCVGVSLLIKLQAWVSHRDENLFMISVLGDFNVTSNNWCKDDTTSHKASMNHAAMSNYGLHKLIQELRHILNSYFSCIDSESVVHSSLHTKCYHQPS